MEQMTQELNLDNHTLKSIKKLYNDSSKSNIFLNTFTMQDVEDGKKHVFSYLMKKYNYKNADYITEFVESSSLKLAKEIFGMSATNTSISGSSSDSLIEKLDAPIYHENHRIINIDSAYRNNLLPKNEIYNPYTSSNMMIDLNDTLDSTIELELANVCIPFTFYNISSDSGNNYFYVREDGGSTVKVSVNDGNYDNASLVAEINSQLGDASGGAIDISFEFNNITNKITMSATNSNEYEVIFYDNSQNSDYSFVNQCSSLDVQSKVNNNLGWILGFRQVDIDNYDKLSYDVKSAQNQVAESICYIPYTKYFIIVIDDMNKNQSNKSLVQINKDKQHINSKKYFKDIDNSLNCLTNDNFDNYVNSSGRSLTKNQLYASLQTNNYRASFNKNNSALSADLINNVFAIVPFDTKSLVWGTSLFTSDKNKFKRKYNGPVNISKLNVKLLDDRGNMINLNGAEWSFSMISTHSYKK